MMPNKSQAIHQTTMPPRKVYTREFKLEALRLLKSSGKTKTEIILLCVRWYLRYSLSYRDLEEMMAERGLSVDHTTDSVRNESAQSAQ